MTGVLGPRVGGAHVGVNLKFDDKSLGQVGKQIHSQLSKLGNSLAEVGKRNGEIYRGIGQNAVTAWRSLLGTIVTSAPLIGSAISAVAGAATLLAGALYSAAQSSFGFAPLLTAIGIAAGTAAIGMQGFTAAVKSGNLKGLTPSAKSAALAVRSLSNEWKSLRNAVQERLFKGLADDIRQLGSTLFPVLEKGLGKMAVSLNGLIGAILRYTNSASGLRTIGALLDNSAAIFDRLSKAAVPALDGLFRLLNALAPAGKRLADRIAEIAKRFQSWTQAEGFGNRIDAMMQRAEKTAGLLFKVLGNLGKALSNVFSAANPATNTFLQMLVGVTQRFADWSASVGGQNAIAEWASNSVEVMRQFGKTASAVFDVIAELADPRVITNFLKTLQGAFEYLGKLPLDKMVDGFVHISEALQPVSSLLLAITIAGASFSIFIGSVVGQLGGLFRILGNIAKPLGGLFKPLASAGKHGKELSGLAAAFGRVAGVVGRFVKFIPFVGWAVAIGAVIAKSKPLQEKFGQLWDAVKGFGSAAMGAFKEIGTALAPLAPVAKGAGKALSFIFDLFDKILGLAIGAFLDVLIQTFKGLASSIKGAGKIIAGLINVLVGLFTLDFGKVWDGLKQMASGIGPLLKGMLGPLASLGLKVITGLASGIVSGIPKVLSTIGSLIPKILMFFATLPLRLLELGGRALLFLGNAFIQGFPIVVGAVGRIVGGIIQFMASLPLRILAFGIQAVTFLLNAFLTGFPRILSAAAQIVTGVIGWIGRLPGRLLTLGGQAISFLANAVGAGIGLLGALAGRILTAVVNAIKALPGRLLSLGRDAISKLAGAVGEGVSRAGAKAKEIATAVTNAVKALPGEMYDIGAKIVGRIADGIKDGISKVKKQVSKLASVIKDHLPGSPVKEGPLTAWNYGGDASGGGRNIVDAITAGLGDTSSIRRAMDGVASAVASSLVPSGAARPAVVSSNGQKQSAVPVAGDTSINVTQNLYGPQTSGGKLRDLDWTLRYATKARMSSAEGMATP